MMNTTSLDQDGAKESQWFLNHYRCPSCRVDWEDEWDCQCNDRCPSCNHEIEPYRSEAIAPEPCVDGLFCTQAVRPASSQWGERP